MARFAAKLYATVGFIPPDDANRQTAWEQGRAAMRGFMYTLQDQLRYYEARRGAYWGIPAFPKRRRTGRRPPS